MHERARAVRVGARVEQQPRDLGEAAARGDAQRREAVAAGRVGARAIARA